jgi:hypothetical protein
MRFSLLTLCVIVVFVCQGKFAQRENLTQVEFINSDVARLNELLFSDNLFNVYYVSPVTEDVIYVVYKKLVNRPNPKGNIFIAAFTTAHARLHLYKAVYPLHTRVKYMDTDSVVFSSTAGQWEPSLSNFLGDWTNEIAHGSKIVEFTTCGPKNYCYTTEDVNGARTDHKKCKGLSLTSQANEMLSNDVMLDQVVQFSSRKRPCEEEEPIAAKRPCLVAQQRKAVHAHTKVLSDTYCRLGAQACLNLTMTDVVASGPCNCSTCSLKTSVTVPQGQFRKHRQAGFVETADIRKEYQLVLNKRWLLRDYGQLPLGYKTLPFGYVDPKL